jgi:hypothetical protein
MRDHHVGVGAIAGPFRSYGEFALTALLGHSRQSWQMAAFRIFTSPGGRPQWRRIAVIRTFLSCGFETSESDH